MIYDCLIDIPMSDSSIQIFMYTSESHQSVDNLR